MSVCQRRLRPRWWRSTTRSAPGQATPLTVKCCSASPSKGVRRPIFENEVRSGFGAQSGKRVVRLEPATRQPGYHLLMDDDDLLRRLRAEAEGSHRPRLGRFTWDGPRPNARTLRVRNPDRCPPGAARCESTGWVDPGGKYIIPPMELHCVRRKGHDGPHYGRPGRLWPLWRLGEVWAWD